MTLKQFLDLGFMWSAGMIVAYYWLGRSELSFLENARKLGRKIPIVGAAVGLFVFVCSEFILTSAFDR